MKPFARINLSSVLPSVALAKVDALRRGILVSSLALAAGCVSGPKVNNAPVSALDLNRYLGEWYEIARFDHSFERGVEQAKAKYSLKDDGTIEVVNSGIKNGKSKTAVGKGKTTDTPGLLRVSFFGPFYADYRVMLRITSGFFRGRLDCLKPRSPNFSQRRNGAAMIQTSSSG